MDEQKMMNQENGDPTVLEPAVDAAEEIPAARQESMEDYKEELEAFNVISIFRHGQ